MCKAIRQMKEDSELIGEKRSAANIVKRLLAKGNISTEDIADVTGLSRLEIEKLRGEIN